MGKQGVYGGPIDENISFASGCATLRSFRAELAHLTGIGDAKSVGTREDFEAAVFRGHSVPLQSLLRLEG